MLWDRIVAFVMRRRALALALSALLTAAAVAVAPGIPFSSGVAAYLPESVPEVKAWLDLSRRFEALGALMVGLEEPERPLTREGLVALRRVTDALAARKADGILGARSLSNIESVREAEDGSLVNELILPEVPADDAGLAEVAQRVAADLQVTGALVSRDQRGYVVLIRTDPRKDASEIARLVERTVERERGPLRAYYFGAPFFTAEITKKVYAQLGWIVPVFVLLLLGVLAAGVRRASVIALVLGSAGVSLLWWLGLVRLFGLGLSQTSLAAALPLLVLAAVAYARGLEPRACGAPADANPFPWPVAATLLALGVASLSLARATIDYLAQFGATVAAGLLAALLFGLLAFAPAASFVRARPRVSAPPRFRFSSNRGVALGLALVLVAGWGAWNTRFMITPQDMFSAKDGVGRALAFFDERLGGTDVLQISYRGDLRDPSAAARLLRLTDLLEGSGAFGDVRSVAQVLGFLGKGFGGVHRIPSDKQALDNLWFFLEGSSDVKNLVSGARDEAMLVLRVPSRPVRPVAELLATAQAAVRQSAEIGREGARLRLLALGRRFAAGVPPERVDQVLSTALRPATGDVAAAIDARVLARLRAFLDSLDSPYQPTPVEWTSLSSALAAPAEVRVSLLIEAAHAIPVLAQAGAESRFAETLLSREKDLRLATRAQALAQSLWQGLAEPPEAYRVRAAGVLADLLDPHARAAAEVPVLVSGMPAVAPLVEQELKAGLWRAIAALLAFAALLSYALRVGRRKVLRALLEGALATALTLGASRLAGLQVDSGSAVLFLLPPLLGFLTADRVDALTGRWRRYPALLLLALAAGGCTLFFTGVLPVTRIGAAMVFGLGSVVVVSWVAGLFRTEAAVVAEQLARQANTMSK